MPVSLSLCRAFRAKTQGSSSETSVDAIQCSHEVFTSRIFLNGIEQAVLPAGAWSKVKEHDAGLGIGRALFEDTIQDAMGSFEHGAGI